MAMTLEEAKKIQNWRRRGSWRWVAERVSEEMPSVLEEFGATKEQALGNQLYGMEFCFMACDLLGEPVEFEDDA
jgi:hypothetical protein